MSHGAFRERASRPGETKVEETLAGVAALWKEIVRN